MMNWFRLRLPAALLLGGLLAATITLIEPAKSAIGNWSEIGVGFSELLTRLALPFAVAFLAAATFAVLLMAAAPRHPRARGALRRAVGTGKLVRLGVRELRCLAH